VGRSRAEVYIHEGLLSRLSLPLRSLIRGGAGSLEGCVVCEEVDEDVFARFAQFFYTGTYKNFAPAEDGDRGSRPGRATCISVNAEARQGNIGPSGSVFPEASPMVAQPVQVQDAFQLPYSLACYTMTADRTHSLFCRFYGFDRPDAMACDCGFGSEGGPSKKKRDFISAFMARHGGLTDVKNMNVWLTIWKTKRASPVMSYRRVFIGHAGVAALADRYAIASLMDLACAHLVDELSQWTISASAFVPDFGGLVRYVYSRVARGCELRLLVAQFAACVIEDVSGLEGWPALLHEVPDFTVDLVNQMIKRFG